MTLLVTSATGANGAGYGKIIAFADDGKPIGVFGSDPRIVDPRGRLVPDAHGAQSAYDDAAIDPIPITDEVTRRFIPRKYLRYLTCNPFCLRICVHVSPYQIPPDHP